MKNIKIQLSIKNGFKILKKKMMSTILEEMMILKAGFFISKL
jgi:hypothetical protein